LCDHGGKFGFVVDPDRPLEEDFELVAAKGDDGVPRRRVSFKSSLEIIGAIILSRLIDNASPFLEALDW
jgi:hypothetical protein